MDGPRFMYELVHCRVDLSTNHTHLIPSMNPSTAHRSHPPPPHDQHHHAAVGPPLVCRAGRGGLPGPGRGRRGLQGVRGYVVRHVRSWWMPGRLAALGSEWPWGLDGRGRSTTGRWGCPLFLRETHDGPPSQGGEPLVPKPAHTHTDLDGLTHHQYQHKQCASPCWRRWTGCWRARPRRTSSRSRRPSTRSAGRRTSPSRTRSWYVKRMGGWVWLAVDWLGSYGARHVFGGGGFGVSGSVQAPGG